MGKRYKTTTPVRRIRRSGPVIEQEQFIDQEQFIGLMMERERLEYMLHSINGTASALLGSMDDSQFESSLLNGMQLTAESVNVDRIYIWKNEIKEKELFYVNRYGWVKDSNDYSGPRRFIAFNYHKDNPVWEEKLQGGEIVNGPVSSLTPLENKLLSEYKIVSILVLPVFLEQHFWGFVSFDDLNFERVFTRDEINILYTYALMMISALNRNIQTKRLNKSYKYSQLMLDATPLSCRIWDKNMNLLDCNDACVRLFQMENKEEYIRRHRECSPMYQPDGVFSLEKSRRMLMTAFREGYCRDMYMHQLPDGETIPTEVTLVRVETDNSVDTVATYTRDMREHLKMMSEIEQRDLLLSTAKDVAFILLKAEPETFEDDLVKCLSMMAKAAKADRSYIWQNFEIKDGHYSGRLIYEWAEGGFAVPTAEYSGRPYLDFFPELETYLSKGKFINGPRNELSEDTHILLKKLRVRSNLIIPVFLNGKFWGFVGFDDSSNDRKFSENEESILHSGCLLIANALQRNDMTQHLQDSAIQLEIALRDAQAASQAKSNFLSNMSHEIRTPINAITGMTSIGKSATDIEKKNYAFDKISGASRHLLGVINDILDMSKIEAAKFELSLIEFSFARMIQKVVDVLAFRVEEKHQELIVDLDERIPAVLVGDDQRLAQVITNLLSNAVKFTGEGKTIRLTAELLEEASDGFRIALSVKDSGIGISAEDQKRLFTSFTQAENSTARKFGGTGLGLAISKRIIDLMNGRLWVESELGEGAQFTFAVSLGRAAGIEKEKQRLRQDKQEESGINIFKGFHMLLVEDMDINREIVAAMMEATGIEMDFASNGHEAVTMVDAAPDKYDIIFMDIQMPEIDGLQATRLIRMLPAERAKSIPIVAMSANVFREDVEKCLAAGMNSHVGKPLDFAEVFEKINQYVVNRI